MADLCDILKSASSRREIENLGVLDTRIFEELGKLSRNIHFEPESDHGQPRQNGIEIYLKGLEDFASGLEDGYRGTAKKANSHLVYGSGYHLGNEAISKADAGTSNRDAESLSYERLVEQFRAVIPVLRKELGVIEQARDPYDLLIMEKGLNNLGHSHIAKNLVSLATIYEVEARKAMDGKLSGRENEELIRQLLGNQEKTPYQHAQLGMIHLLRGELQEAQPPLTQARQMLDGKVREGTAVPAERALYDSLEHVAPSVLAAHSILQPVYLKIKFLREV